MPTGIYREGQWVIARFSDKDTLPITKEHYVLKGYRPLFDELPTRAEHEARKA